MCATCMASATTTVAAATGIRAWLAVRRPRWATAGRMRAVTGALLASAVVAAGLVS